MSDPCLSCSLPKCDEHNPLCAYHPGYKPWWWQVEREAIQALGMGEAVTFGPFNWAALVRLQQNISTASRQGRIHKVATYRHWDVPFEVGWLDVRRV